MHLMSALLHRPSLFHRIGVLLWLLGLIATTVLWVRSQSTSDQMVWDYDSTYCICSIQGMVCFAKFWTPLSRHHGEGF